MLRRKSMQILDTMYGIRDGLEAGRDKHHYENAQRNHATTIDSQWSHDFSRLPVL